jgi:hypothetical protein
VVETTDTHDDTTDEPDHTDEPDTDDHNVYCPTCASNTDSIFCPISAAEFPNYGVVDSLSNYAAYLDVTLELSTEKIWCTRAEIWYVFKRAIADFFETNGFNYYAELGYASTQVTCTGWDDAVTSENPNVDTSATRRRLETATDTDTATVDDDADADYGCTVVVTFHFLFSTVEEAKLVVAFLDEIANGALTTSDVRNLLTRYPGLCADEADVYSHTFGGITVVSLSYYAEDSLGNLLGEGSVFTSVAVQLVPGFMMIAAVVAVAVGRVL